MSADDKGPPSIYELHPPAWLPKAHSTADLGYVGFYPPRPDEEEEILTESNVKNGLVLKLTMPAETYSTQEHVRSRFCTDEALGELADLMNQIFLRRAENVPPVPPPSFRMPSRITLNEAKRHAWFADLANPDVPLYKLGKNVPHGAKGHDLLDLLHTNKVAIPRAVWLLRVFGGNETTGLRNKPGYNPTQYSVEWANVVTSYIKKQLADIALPTAPRPGLNIKQMFKSVLADPDSRERWISRFTYCLSLLRNFYADGLVDNRTFLAWLVQQVSGCNFAQLAFVARLADEYLEGMLGSRALTHCFVEACLRKLSEIQTTCAKDYLGNLEATLKNLIARAFLALPDAFVSPRMWMTHVQLLEGIVSESIALSAPESTAGPSTQSLHQAFSDHLADVKRRNEAMLFRHLPPRVVGSLTSALSDIKLLNSLSGKTDMDAVVFFSDPSDADAAPSFPRKLDILLTWSVTSLQYGDHRPYAAACLLRLWRDKAGERAIRHEAASPDEYIHDQIFDWLDTSRDAAEQENLPAVALLFGQLVKHGLFSYQEYIQRLIARGEVGLSFGQEERSRHRDFLRWISLHNADASLIRQRKVALYGVRAREIPEDIKEREIRKEIRALLPELFGGPVVSDATMTTIFWASCETLLSAPRYEQVRVMKQWLRPILRKFISNQDAAGSSNAHVLKIYTLTIILMARTKCYGSILDLTLLTLERATTSELLNVVIETLRQHMEVWACMNMMRTVAAALYKAHQFWRTRGIQTRPLLYLLMEVDNDRYLEPEQREKLLADVSAYSHALLPANQHSDEVPERLPEILLLATDLNPDAPSNLAKSLWYKYRTAADWAWKVWGSTVASLVLIPAMVSNVSGRRACSLRYAEFLSHIDQHLPQGFDKHILDWFLGPGATEIASFTADTWDVVTVVLLHLCVCGALNTTTILRALIYPIWNLGTSAASIEQGQALEIRLAAANTLFEHLLLKDECGNGMPPADIFEAQGLQTRRRDVFREPFFSLLADNLPALVFVERNPMLSEELRQASLALRQSLCQFSVFRLGVYRDLDAVRRTFERLLESQDISDDLHEHLVAALRLMLRDPASQGDATNSTGFVAVSSLLTPWKLAATAIEIRLTLKQLEEGLGREATRAATNATLDRLATFVFQQCKTPEEADFVAEMMTEVSREVAGKFVNAGFLRVVELFNEACNASLSLKQAVREFVANAGEVLRLLSKIVERFRDDGSLPSLIPAIQDSFIVALDARLMQVMEALAEESVAGLGEEHARQGSHCAIFLCRLLQFDLGFPEAWTTQTKLLSESLCNTITQLALLHGAGASLDLVAFPLLLDTLYYLLDEAPTDTKLTFDPFRNYPTFELAQLPSDMPPHYRARLRTLLPYVPLNCAVENLAYASRDPSSGALTFTHPVQNRPWEWTEYLGDIPPGDAVALSKSDLQERQDGDRPSIRNSASISLELFGARLTGDRIIHRSTVAGTGDAMLEETVRSFQDNLANESVFMRDWRETRIRVDDEIGGRTNLSVRTEGHDSDGGGMPGSVPGNAHSQGQKQATPERSSSRRPSPINMASARSQVTRNSGLGQHTSSGPSSSASSLRQSPAGQSQQQQGQHPLSRLSVSTTATASEVIDVDSFDFSSIGGVSAGGTAKRKAADQDDDIEIVEEARTGMSRQAAKKTRTKAATSTTKTRAKKR